MYFNDLVTYKTLAE